MGKKQNVESEHLLTTRAALVLILAVATSVGVGSLVYLGRRDVPEAVLAGLAAFAAAVPLLLAIIGP